MRDASVVSQETLHAVAVDVAAEAVEGNVVKSVAAREPVLAAYIGEKMLVVSGKLALSGAPPEVVQGCYEEVANLVVTSVRAVWAGSDELWKGIHLPDVARPRRGRRARGSGRPVAAPPRESGETGSVSEG